MINSRPLRLVFGLALLAVIVWLVDPAAVLEVVRRLDYRWLAPAGGAILASTLIGAGNAWLLIAHKGEISLRAFLPIFWAGWALSLVVPGQVGDVAGMSALLRRHRFAWQDSVGRSLLDKAISLAVMLLLAGAGLLVISRAGNGLALDRNTVWLAAALIVLAGAAAVAVFRLPAIRDSRAGRFIEATLAELLRTAHQNPGRVLLNTAMTVVKIGLIGTAYWCVFRATGAGEVDWFAVVCLACASSLVAYVPITINGLGTAELTGVVLFTAVGVDQAAVVTAYLVLRVMVLLLAWLPAAAFLSLGQARHQPLR